MSRSSSHSRQGSAATISGSIYHRGGQVLTDMSQRLHRSYMRCTFCLGAWGGAWMHGHLISEHDGGRAVGHGR